MVQLEAGIDTGTAFMKLGDSGEEVIKQVHKKNCEQTYRYKDRERKEVSLKRRRLFTDQAKRVGSAFH